MTGDEANLRLADSNEARLTVVLAGRPGAGKTTVGKRLAGALNVPLASFGNVVRSEANARGLNHERRTLQALAQELIETVGWTAFCKRALAAAGVEPPQVCVIDGVRHLEALETLRSRYSPIEVTLVWLDLPDEERAARLRARGDDPRLLTLLERHAMERQGLDVLPAAADLRVASDDGATQRIVEWINRRRR